MDDYDDRFQAEVMAAIRAEIAAQQRTASSVADDAGLKAQSVLRYLKGERDMPVSVLIDIAKALDVSPVEIFATAETRLNPPPMSSIVRLPPRNAMPYAASDDETHNDIDPDTV